MNIVLLAMFPLENKGKLILNIFYQTLMQFQPTSTSIMRKPHYIIPMRRYRFPNIQQNKGLYATRFVFVSCNSHIYFLQCIKSLCLVHYVLMYTALHGKFHEYY